MEHSPVDPWAEPPEKAEEAALRPGALAEFGGQQRVAEQLGLVLAASQSRGTTPDHVLLSGPPGLGKTTLAMIIAAEMSAPIRISSGPAIQHAGDLAAILSSLVPGEVFFLDEIHRMSKGPGATAIPIDIPPFTLVGATTRAGLLPGPLRDRFGFTAQLDYYQVADLERIVTRSAGVIGVDLAEGTAHTIASRSRGTPRIANRLLRRVRDWADVNDESPVTPRGAETALDLYEVDPLGLDRLDRAVLNAVCLKFGGGPVGLSTLAISVGEEPQTVEEVAEPFLVRLGFLMRTPRGRVATDRAWRHLGLEPPTNSTGDGLF